MLGAGVFSGGWLMDKCIITKALSVPKGFCNKLDRLLMEIIRCFGKAGIRFLAGLFFLLLFRSHAPSYTLAGLLSFR